ncbi:hypothetical protein NJH78_03975 [Pseudomonas chlororaphis]|uniref:hypothetical protein n=1 Tax=Pseudomonas chlororaphis TaxID=587753 RepID=UPI00209A9F24|nr:hypothetical protein [Pseudomonas chlororaphis]MCO7569124.1 hypothetical protein [Pseudomonas chlororaphis]MCO7587031.1 hypothetical protein [Pseudomonas chlororaphis]
MRKKNLYAWPILTALFATLPHINACASDTNERYITDWEFFNQIIKRYKSGIKNKKDIENSSKAEARGKEAFLNNDYVKAEFHGYGDALAWIPRPEYYFIIGDIQLRSKLHLHTDSPYSTPEYKACWDKYLFALDARRSVIDHFERGFSLTAELNLSATKNSKIYQQALTNAACFARLTSKYSEGVGPQCVPVEEVKSCLGTPLLFLYH